MRTSPHHMERMEEHGQLPFIGILHDDNICVRRRRKGACCWWHFCKRRIPQLSQYVKRIRIRVQPASREHTHTPTHTGSAVLSDVIEWRQQNINENMYLVLGSVSYIQCKTACLRSWMSKYRQMKKPSHSHIYICLHLVVAVFFVCRSTADCMRYNGEFFECGTFF